MPEERKREGVIFGNVKGSLPNMALTALLCGILVPPVMYGIGNFSPSPTQVITSVCISVFAGILYLWILDATAVFRFRSAWTSRSVFAVGISSILAATVGIYKDAFTDRLHPLDGRWQVSMISEGHQDLHNLGLMMYYGKSSNAYSGYSGYQPARPAAAPSGSEEAGLHVSHLSIDRLDPETKTATVSIWSAGFQTIFHTEDVHISNNSSSIEMHATKSAGAPEVVFVLTRS